MKEGTIPKKWKEEFERKTRREESSSIKGNQVFWG